MNAALLAKPFIHDQVLVDSLITSKRFAYILKAALTTLDPTFILQQGFQALGKIILVDMVAKLSGETIRINRAQDRATMRSRFNE